MAHGTDPDHINMTPAGTGNRSRFCAPHMAVAGVSNQVSFDGGAQNNEIHHNFHADDDIPCVQRLDSRRFTDFGGAGGAVIMKSTLDIMHHAVCYCRRNEDELAAQVIEKCLEQTVAFKRRQAGIKQELNILSRQDSRNRDRAAKVQEILPAGLTAHVSESNVSESYYVRVSDLAGNLIIECRVSGHIRPCGTHENECNNLDEAISTITAALGVGR